MILAPIISGIVIGALAGMIPGVSVTLLMLMLVPVLMQFDLLTVFLFYFSLLITTQYFGSITAIAYGFPGEVSSVPAVTHGHPMMMKGQGDLALSATATGSFFGGMIGCMFLLLIYFNSEYLKVLFNTAFLTMMYVTVLIIVVAMARQRVLAMCLLLAGLVLGKAGFDSLHGQHFLLPAYTEWELGLPFFPLFAGLLIVPMMLRFMQQEPRITTVQIQSPDWRTKMSMLVDRSHWTSWLRGSLTGSLMGLVPGASYLMSSNVADSVERKFSKNNGTKQMVAAESANNAGCITVLIPLLVFAIPIVPSEAILLDVVQSKGFSNTMSLGFISQQLPVIILCLVLVNLANWVLSGYFYNTVLKIYHLAHRYIYTTMLIVCLIIMIYLAWTDGQQLSSLLTFAGAFMLGWAIRDDYTKSTMIFGFFLSDTVLDEFYRFLIIYF